MKLFLKILTIVLIPLLLYGCAGAMDFQISLPRGYSVLRSSAHMITINKKKYENSLDETVIPAKVDEIVWNDKYILVKQIALKKRDTSNEDDAYEIPDQSKVYYWIIQIDTDEVYSLLSYEEFMEKKKELHIPNNLILEKVSFYNES
ncbi:DUF3997 domain-containing protein [Clostridium botulinum]|nr:DUF3997 domain-containing protein [Clostridium botulinum]